MNTETVIAVTGYNDFYCGWIAGLFLRQKQLLVSEAWTYGYETAMETGPAVAKVLRPEILNGHVVVSRIATADAPQGSVIVRGTNEFYDGWIAAVLLQPERPDAARGWQDGWHSAGNGAWSMLRSYIASGWVLVRHTGWDLIPLPEVLPDRGARN